jgi:hypothetical protein
MYEEERDLTDKKLSETQQKAAEALDKFVEALIDANFTIDLEYAPQLFWRLFFRSEKDETGKVKVTPNRLGIIRNRS